MRLNGCPCGYYGDPQKPCSCSPSIVSRYQRRISGPMLDRIDIFVEVPRVEYEKLVAPPGGDTSEGVSERVTRSRAVQRRRFGEGGIASNAEMGPVEVWDHCQVGPGAEALLQMAMRQLNFSARGYHRVLKVARTIADLACSETIETPHLA